MTTELATLPALEIARLVAAREASPVEVIESSIARIERINPAVNAIAASRAEAALEDAHAAEKRLGSEPPRPLEGVPFTVKDLAPLADVPMALGSRAFEGFQPRVDGNVVRRLREAGAIPVAKTTTSEFGYRPTTETELMGPTRNAWNAERVAGGSSGGAGVAAALGFAPLNQGSDGGGSIRIPAACNGVFGLKPARGRISYAPLEAHVWEGFSVIGPLVRTVADAAAFLDATAGPVTGDPYWAPPPARPFLDATRQDPPRLRIAVAYERDGETVDGETKDAVRASADLLASLGHDVFERTPDFKPLEEPFVLVTTACMAVLPLDERLDRIEPRNRLIWDVAANIRAADYVRAVNRMGRDVRKAMTFFDDVDVLLTPALSRPAPPIGGLGADIENAWEDYRNWLCWTWPFNVTGQPAATLPLAMSSDGLPIGVQIVGRPADEATVLALSAQIERARPWADRRPPAW